MGSKIKLENSVWGFSSILIILLALVNPGAANDNHFEVIELIKGFGTLPKSDQCWQCYHPPLYHWLVAQIWNIGGLIELKSKWISAQLVNAVCGIGTLFLIKKFIYKSNWDRVIKHLLFVFVAFNPRLIAINTQASNDALIIFWGTANIFFLYKISKKIELSNVFGLITSLTLASMTKLNFGILLIANILVLLLMAVKNKNWSFGLKKGYLGTLILILGLSSLIMLFINGYYNNLKSEGKVLTYNTPTSKLPHLYKRPDVYINGIQSIYHGYFTFQLMDMLKHPKIDIGPNAQLKHMTSHFSQLYGRFTFLFFDDWPTEWRTQNAAILNIGKASFILNLLPFLMMLWGIVLIFLKSLTEFLNKGMSLKNTSMLLNILGFIAFSVLFSMLGKNYTFMKVIYILPGFLAFVYAYGLSIENLVAIRHIKYILGTITIAIASLNIVTIVYLIIKLSGINYNI